MAAVVALAATAIYGPVATSRAQPAPGLGAPVELLVAVAGANGEGRIQTPRRAVDPQAGPCAGAAQRAYWNYEYSGSLPAGAFSGLPGELRLHLAVHSDVVRTPNIGTPEPPGGPSAFLLGDASHVSLLNPRGSLKVRLRSGTCDAPTLAFDGISAAGAGTWEVDSGEGAYREATGSGTFSIAADVAPGADNPFSIQLDGAVSVLQPSLEVEVLQTYWGGLGTDYLSRRPTVVFRVTNAGPGDAFDVRIDEITSTTAGVDVWNTLHGHGLGDLRAGESEIVSTRFQLGLLSPCQLLILGCAFSTTTAIEWADALGVTSVPSVDRQAIAPDLPPPL